MDTHEPPVDAVHGEPTAHPVAAEPQPTMARTDRPTRTGATFKSLMAGLLVLVLLILFILENTQRIKISYFGASGHLALGVALLIAAVAGGLLTGIVGTARLAQLRHRARRQR